MTTSASGDTTVTLEGHRPPVLSGDGVRGILTPALAVTAWGAAVLRHRMTDAAIDPFGLIIEVIALALTVRACFDLVRLARRLRVFARARGYRLTLGEDELQLETPQERVTLSKADIIDIREEGGWQNRPTGRRYSHVFLVLAPGKERLYIALPPVFEATPGVLAERLMRWRGALQGLTVEGKREPLASKVYDEAATGRVRPGDTAIRHGRSWLTRGPYTSLLLSVLLFYTWLQLPELTSVRIAFGLINLPTIAATLLLIPFGWVVLTLRHILPRKGLALVTTPAEILMRIRSGVLRARWATIERVTIESLPAWSVILGYRRQREVVFRRYGAPPIRYQEAYLGVPAEVVQGLCEAYLRGLSADPASQGSGAGAATSSD